MRLAAVLVVFLLSAGAFAPQAAAQPTGLPKPVAQALARAKLPESGVAVYVHEIGAQRPVVAHNANRVVNPASTMKLVTTYAALELLGPAYVWHTEAYGGAPLVNGVLNGDLKAGSLTVAAGSRMRGRAEFGWDEKGGK